MKKLLITLSFVLIPTFSFASSGSSNGRDLQFKNSEAGFVSESVEHSMRIFSQTQFYMAVKVTGLQVQIPQAGESLVTLSLSDGNEMTYTCFQFDDWSRSGTVLKKEVACR